MTSETVSVIVPVYNAEKYLPRCLQSIESQTYTDLEIVLVDDGSTDASGRICDDFAAKDTRVKVIHQDNRGQWAARNAGQDASTGEYLFFPDADDYFHRDIVRLMYDALNRNDEYDLAIVREKKTWQTNEDVCSTIEPHLFEQTRDTLIKNLFVRTNDRYYVYMWNKLFRRRLINDLRTREYVRFEDFDFIFRALLKTSKALLIDNDLYFWFQHHGSLSNASCSPLLDSACQVRVSFRNYLEIPSDNAVYLSLLLSRMYRAMVFWKARAMAEKNTSLVFRECREYERVTRSDYLTDRRIGIIERAGCFILLHCPRLAVLMLRVTKNL